MKRIDRETEVSPTERTVPNDPERTIAAPRFDENSIQSAQPAVPLTWRGRARRWPLAVVALSLVAGIIIGVLGGMALTRLRKGETRAASGQTTPQQGADSGPLNPDGSSNPLATNVPPAQEEAGAKDASGQGAAQVPDAREAAGKTVAGAPETAGDVRSAGHGVGPKMREADEAQAPAVEAAANRGTQTELRAALDEWIAATNARDVGRQMKFYAPTVNAFYLWRNASRDAVRDEKTRVFGQADSVDVRASEPDIRLSPDGQTAVMLFRKRYQIGGRSGQVLQELRWRRTPAGWKIVSERDLRVIQ